MNRDWARAFLLQAADAAGVDHNFAESVMSGLDLGAQRYGEDDYRDRDNAEGGSFESRDAAAYALMDYDAMDADLAAGADPELIESARMHLAQAMRLAAELELCFLVARRSRAEARAAKRLTPLRRQTKGTAP